MELPDVKPLYDDIVELTEVPPPIVHRILTMYAMGAIPHSIMKLPEGKIFGDTSYSVLKRIRDHQLTKDFIRDYRRHDFLMDQDIKAVDIGSHILDRMAAEALDYGNSTLDRISAGKAVLPFVTAAAQRIAKRQEEKERKEYLKQLQEELKSLRQE